MARHTIWQSGVLLLVSMLLVSSAPAQFFGGRGGGFGGGFGDEDVELLDQYDKDHNGYLDKSERQVAFGDLGGDTNQDGFDRRRRMGPGSSTAVVKQPVNEKLTPAQVKQYGDKPLYDPAVVRTLFLSFEDSNWEAQMVAYKNTDIEMPATAVIDGKTYRNVGVHFRGQTSFMQVSDGYKRSLKIDLNMVEKQQRFLGYQALELLNANSDPGFLRTVLYLQMARDYLPAPKANFMRVVINGESWGIYVNKQPFNGDFVKEATGNSGARWKIHGTPNSRGGLEYWGDNLENYKSTFRITSKDREEDWAALVNLTKVLNQTPAARLEAALKPILDIDGVLRFLALDNALINNDGYWVRASDYSLYRDAKGVFHVTPHDTNESMRDVERMGRFGGGRSMSSSGTALDPLVSINDDTKPLLSKLLAVPALKQRYLDYMRDIATRWLDWKKLGPIATQYHALIANDVKADNRKLYSNTAFDMSLQQDGEEGGGFMGPSGMSLKTFADQRRAYLLSYLATSASGAKPARSL